MGLEWRGGMGGRGPLPYGGGYARQPSGLMHALRFVAGLTGKFERKPGDRRG